MKKLVLVLFVICLTNLFGQGKLYIWQNNAITDSVDITNSLKMSFKQGSTVPADTTTDSLNIPTNGLVAYYPFNNSANDASGNNNNGTCYDGVISTSDRFRNPNSAYKFAYGNYIEVPRSASLEPTTGLTLVAWVHPDSIQAWGSIVNKRYDELFTPYNSYFLGQTPNANKWSFFTNVNNYVYDTATIKPFVWTCLVATWNGFTNCLYINGNKVAEVANTKAIPYSSLSLRIGAAVLIDYKHRLEQGFNGVIDDVRIYNRALGQAEIKAVYHEGGWTGN